MITSWYQPYFSNLVFIRIVKIFLRLTLSNFRTTTAGIKKIFLTPYQRPFSKMLVFPTSWRLSYGILWYTTCIRSVLQSLTIVTARGWPFKDSQWSYGWQHLEIGKITLHMLSWCDLASIRTYLLINNPVEFDELGLGFMYTQAHHIRYNWLRYSFFGS